MVLNSNPLTKEPVSQPEAADISDYPHKQQLVWLAIAKQNGSPS
jgi:hypothetical protein